MSCTHFTKVLWNTDSICVLPFGTVHMLIIPRTDRIAHSFYETLPLYGFCNAHMNTLSWHPQVQCSRGQLQKNWGKVQMVIQAWNLAQLFFLSLGLIINLRPHKILPFSKMADRFSKWRPVDIWILVFNWLITFKSLSHSQFILKY